MAYNKTDGIVDFFGGKEDIENLILRAVGDPEKRFLEDALRILRLVRFASTLEFQIEEKTFSDAIKCAVNLKTISSERIFTELYKASIGKNFSVIAPFLECGALSFLKIEKLPDFGVIKKVSSLDLAFFTFLHFSSTDILKTLELLKVSGKFKNYCTNLEEILQIKTVGTKADIKRLLLKFDAKHIKDGLILKGILENTSYDNVFYMLQEILQNGEPYLIKHLAITGEILENIGFRGKQIGEILKQLQLLVIESPKLNTTETLLEKLNEISP